MRFFWVRGVGNVKVSVMEAWKQVIFVKYGAGIGVSALGRLMKG